MRTVCNIVGDSIGLGIVDHFDKVNEIREKLNTLTNQIEKDKYERIIENDEREEEIEIIKNK